MRVCSLFAGVDGLNLGDEYDIDSFVEIDTACQDVLRYHHPGVPIHGDITTYEDHSPVDVVVGGSPCQDLSVAGKRRGLGGKRSGLFWEQIRVTRQRRASWAVWENVPGALTSNGGADFAAVLWGYTGVWPEVPAHGWRSAGVLAGPRWQAVWRVLDAQHFGVKQRRRRLYVVAGSTAADLVTVLLDEAALDATRRTHESQWGDSQPVHLGARRIAVKTRRAANSSDPERWVCGGDELVAPTLTSFDTGMTRATTLVIERDGARVLTPLECERLMGWPAGWTAYGRRPDGTTYPLPDTTRYRMCGNGAALPVSRWIGRRLMERATSRVRVR